MKTSLNLIFLFLILIFTSFTTSSTKSLKLVTTKSTAKVTGTSSLHDWEMKVTKVEGYLDVERENTEILNISNLKLTFYANGLSSGKDMMDDKAYEALKEKVYPKITFELTKIISNKAIKEMHQIKAIGNLTIAGVTKEITTVAYCQFNSNDELNITGNQLIDMTAFGIKTPTALLGTVTTGKDVTLKYNITMK